MRGKLLAQVLRGLAAAVVARHDVPADEAELMLAQALGTAPLTPAQRSRRYRDGKKRRRDETSRESVTESDEKATADATDPVPPLHSPSDPDPEISKEIVVVSEGSDRSSRVANQPGTTTPTDFESAMRETPAARAAAAHGNAELSKLLRVTSWPEVVELTTLWHHLRGHDGVPRLRDGDRDVDALLGVLALGYDQEFLARALRHLAKHHKFSHIRLLRALLKDETLKIAEDEMAQAAARSPAPRSAPRRAEPDQTPEERAAAADLARAQLRTLLAHERRPPAPVEEPPLAAGAEGAE